MRYYFSLQFKRLIRWLEEVGVYPYLAILLMLIMFFGVSELLFHKTEMAQWIYLFLGTYCLLELSDKRKTQFLKNIYPRTVYYKIRSVENFLIAIPFETFLLYKEAFLPALVLPLIVCSLIFLNQQWQATRVLPTPFKRFPFEFIVGFRKTILFLVFAGFLIIKAVQVDNYNLGLAGLGLIFLLALSFYFKPELKYFVWIYSDTAIGFLKRKILESFMCTSILTSPALIVLCIFFPDKLVTSFIVYLIAFAFVGTIVLAKYSAFPKEMNLPQAIFFGLSIWFPPILLFAIPIFYKMSKKNLKPILE